MIMSQEQKKWVCDVACKSKLLSEYLDFLRNHRGLTENTIGFRRNDVALFLKALRLQNESEDIGQISVKEIQDYVTKTAKLMNRPSRKHLVASIRSFLKFCHFKGMSIKTLQRPSRSL